MAPTEGNRQLHAMLSEISQELGGDPLPALDPSRRGAADISFVAPYTDALAGLGAHGESNHSPDERLDLDSLPTAIKRAAHHYRRAYDIGVGRKYVLSPALETKFRLRRGRRYLKRALQEARFLKIGDLDLVVQPSFKLGYRPRVILNYRQLELNLPSLLVGRTHIGPDQLAGEYVRIYRQGLMLLRTFGGCTVEYNELQDVAGVAWADALAATTGLDKQALLDSRKQRLKGPADPRDVTPIYAEAYTLFETMRSLSGDAIEPSRQVTRVLMSSTLTQVK